MTVRWGALSAARINRLVLDGARASDRVDFIAVASRERSRAEMYAREHGIEALHRSAEAGTPVDIELSTTVPVPASHWSDA